MITILSLRETMGLTTQYNILSDKSINKLINLAPYIQGGTEKKEPIKNIYKTRKCYPF